MCKEKGMLSSGIIYIMVSLPDDVQIWLAKLTIDETKWLIQINFDSYK